MATQNTQKKENAISEDMAINEFPFVKQSKKT